MLRFTSLFISTVACRCACAACIAEDDANATCLNTDQTVLLQSLANVQSVPETSAESASYGPLGIAHTMLETVKDWYKESSYSGSRDQDLYGDSHCRCVGIDKIEGETMVTLRNGATSVSYPADLGSHCEAWDAHHHPKCPGESWCLQAWCYVDPCKCKSISPLPKPSIYLPGAKYQGRPVHFSYATCGSTDSYSAAEEKKTAKHIKETCDAKVDSATWGMKKCRCVGIGPQPGSTHITIKGKSVPFPGDTGATCKAWEKDNHPECAQSSPPSWCSQAWCYVDPCSCNLAEQPKTSSYLPDARYQGKPLYYSYATCSSADSFTSEMENACVNQKTQSKCSVLSRCAWTGSQCLGKELVSVCSHDEHSRASFSNVGIALALLAARIFW